jgi:protein gp37
MAENSTIEWTDHTWSPWEGCTKVSPGCDHCYAEAMNRWLRGGENWGPGAPRRIYSEDHWDKPVRWQRNALKFETLHGRRQRVFPSVCDPFDNEALPTLRARLWGLIRLTPAIDWLLLTERIGNARDMLPSDWGAGYPNVWIGATMVDQNEVDRDARKLLALPARHHFVSYEPALGPIDLTPWLKPYCDAGSRPHPDGGGTTCSRCDGAGGCGGLSWVIAGGESGRHARPAHPDWFRSLEQQCRAAGVAFFMKQMGGVRDKRGALDDLPEDLRVREMP